MEEGVSGKAILVLGAAVAVVAWATGTMGLLRRLPGMILFALGALFVLAAVRIGYTVAVLAFDSSLLSYLIPACAGIAAWLLRPGR